ncbi:Six-bladed beta-propeller TolB-like protein [Neofusicoccum parvum]|nr:Six-bladed beta-propeller TolB-like protein [Neofusicoccum parvum]
MWDGFVDVMQSPWWTRFWVVQECLLPPKATVVFGHWRIPWDTLKVAEQNHRQHILTCCSAAWKAFPKRYAFYPDRLISDTRTAADRGKGAFYDLDRALRAYRHRDCQNPRDKVFGILGLVDRSKYPQLRPDYSLSVRDVYVQAMEAILGEGEGSLRCLTGSGFNSQQQQRMLPSWVRDLAACPDHEILFHEMARLEAYTLYNASAADTPPVKPRFSEDGDLCVKGRVVDEIEKVGPAILHRELKHIMLVLGDWHRTAGLKVLRSPAALEDDRKQQAFWRTVVGDVVPDGDERGWRRLAPHDWKDYGRWLFSMKKARMKALFGWKTEPPFEARFVKAMLSAVYGRALFVTRKGSIGLCYPETRVGDEVWVLHGGSFGAWASVYERIIIFHVRADGKESRLKGLFDSLNQFLNTTNFVAYDEAFFDIIGPEATITHVQSLPYQIHEAPCLIPGTKDLFFVEWGLPGGDNGQHTWQYLLNTETNELRNITTDPPTVNVHGCVAHNGSLYIVTDGGLNETGYFAHVDPATWKRTTLLNHYYEQPFLGFNDIAVDPSGNFYLTDSKSAWGRSVVPWTPPTNPGTYFVDGRTLRPKLVQLTTGNANGVAVSPDGGTVYLADTGAAGFPGQPRSGLGPRGLWAFDVARTAAGAAVPVLNGRRLLNNPIAYTYDGLRVSREGWVWAGAGDGVDVLDPVTGLALGSVRVGGGRNVAVSLALGRHELWIVGAGGVWRVSGVKAALSGE